MTRLARSLRANLPKQFDDNLAADVQLLQYILQLGLYCFHVDPSHEQDAIDRAATVLIEIPATEHWVAELLAFVLILHSAHEGRGGVL